MKIANRNQQYPIETSHWQEYTGIHGKHYLLNVLVHKRREEKRRHREASHCISLRKDPTSIKQLKHNISRRIYAKKYPEEADIICSTEKGTQMGIPTATENVF